METQLNPNAEILELVDKMLSAALREVRKVRALGPVPASRKRDRSKSRSNTEVCLDILVQNGHPLHVSALVQALARSGIRTSRDSLVSAMTKRIAPSGPFLRTAGNTFGLAGRDKLEE